MNPTKDAPLQLQPLPVVLSALHLPTRISALQKLSGIEVSLPKTDTSSSMPFKAIVSESTDRNLLLKSFYDFNVRGKVFDGNKYAFSSLADQGISRCTFTSTYGILAGQPFLNDQTAPQFKVDGVSRVPFIHQGYFFSPRFLICDHIFCHQEYETQFVAVLSLDFLREYFIRAQFNEKGWRIQLPLYIPTQIDELPIFTDGCCLSNGHAAADPEVRPARGGYGIHFPTLPDGWDMYGALASNDSHTNQKAELTAVIRALQLVRLRNIPCVKLSIFTDSKYAVQGLNDWIPNLWRSNGYRTSKNREVVNADLFKSLDEEVSLALKSGISVTLNHIPREQNKEADALSKLGATSQEPLVMLTNPKEGSNKEAKDEAKGKTGIKGKKGVKAEMDGGVERDGRPSMILGKNLFDQMKPLVQWSPDGFYWAQWQPIGGPGERLESGMKMLVVHINAYQSRFVSLCFSNGATS